MNRIAVLGAGTMGCGIAELFATHDHHVTLVDVNEETLRAGLERIRSSLTRVSKRGSNADLTDVEAVMQRIHATISLADAEQCGVVIESVIEDLEAKSAVLAEVSHLTSDALIATNTSGLSVTAIARAVRAPERFVGLHFFNPVPRMPLVEVVRALQSDDTTVQRAADLVRSVGKETVTVDDQPGFLVNRLLIPYLNQCIQDHDEGLASTKDIDDAVRLGLGYPMGPFELLDLIGLDTHQSAARTAYEQTRDPNFAPPPLLQRMVAAGWLGDKAGRGFRNDQEEKE